MVGHDVGEGAPGRQVRATVPNCQPSSGHQYRIRGPTRAAPRSPDAASTEYPGGNCEDAIAAFERSRGVKTSRRPLAPPSAVVGGVPPPLPPTGYTVDPAPGDLSRALVGRRILYWWGEEGWQLGSVARVSSQASFSHVVAYHRRSSALSGTAHSLLDAASYGSTWVALSPLPHSWIS